MGFGRFFWSPCRALRTRCVITIIHLITWSSASPTPSASDGSPSPAIATAAKQITKKGTKCREPIPAVVNSVAPTSQISLHINQNCIFLCNDRSKVNNQKINSRPKKYGSKCCPWCSRRWRPPPPPPPLHHLIRPTNDWGTTYGIARLL